MNYNSNRTRRNVRLACKLNLLCITSIYLFGVFYELTFNITEWHENTRFTCIIFSSVNLICFIIAIIVVKSKKNDRV